MTVARKPQLLKRSLIAALLLILTAAGVLAYCEWRGWPMLRRPAEDWAAEKLKRTVSFDGSGARWKLRLLQGPKLEVERMEIGAPSWSTLGPTLVAGHATLVLRWRDVLALRRGEPLVVQSLAADTLALRVQRLPDGRASWQFGEGKSTTAARGNGLSAIRFEELAVRQGTAVVDDKQQTLSLVAKFALREGNAKDAGIRAEAEGRYRGLPVEARLRSGSALPWLSSDPNAPAVPVDFHVRAGRGKLDFEGQVRDLIARQGLQGHYTVSGPSLAAVGEPLGLTLPSTPAFEMRGRLTREGTRWASAVEQASIGKSRMAGDFVLDKPANQKSKLTGELRAPVLWLTDLGPAIGTDAPPAPPSSPKSRRVLPDRHFDLPSLKAMNADVRLRIERLETGIPRLQDLRPLNTHLLLADGVLTLDDIDARLAQGRVTGRIRLDGREPVAAWDTQLRLRNVQLEQWIKQDYVTGRIGARLDLKGRGRSTAELLGSADGKALIVWTRGTASHLLIEGAGIDVAQALGVLLRGDDKLKVRCGAADLALKQGVARPKVFVVDTEDSVLNLEGAISLATERLALAMRVSPKDVSPLTLRTPVRIEGTFSDPDVSLDKTGLAKKVVPALALASINPLAGLLPLIDPGDRDDGAALQQCRQALEQARGL